MKSKKTLTFIFLLLYSLTGITQPIEKEFYEAISKNDKAKMIEILQSKKEILNKEFSSYSYPLFYAIYKKNYDAALTLIELGASVNVKKEDGMNALHHLALIGNPSEKDLEKIITLLKTLKSKGCDINAFTKTGYTPLHYLVREGGTTVSQEKIKLIEAFIEQGANPKLDTKVIDKTPLLLEVIGNLKKGEMRKRDGSIAILGEAAFEYMKILIKKGYDVNVTDSNKNTALILLARKNLPEDKKIEMIKFLLEHKANIKAKNKEGKKAADYVDKNSPIYELLK